MEEQSVEEGAIEAVKGYMRAWRIADFKRMLRWTNKSWYHEYGTKGSFLQDTFSMYTFASWTVGDPTVVSAYMVDVPVTLVNHDGSEKNLVARVIRESGPYRPSKKGTWGVNPFSTMRQEQELAPTV